MIISLFPLPEFHTRGIRGTEDCIQAYSEVQTDDSGEGLYLPFNMTIRHGRNLVLQRPGTPPLRKYKMECIFGCIPWDVVMVAGDDIQPYALGNLALCNHRIFPLYARNLQTGQTILFVNQINRLFEGYAMSTIAGTTKVMSVIEYMHRILWARGSSYLIDRTFDYSIAPVFCDEPLITLISVLANDGGEIIDAINLYVNKYAVSIPVNAAPELNIIRNACWLRELMPLFNPGARTELAATAYDAKPGWNSLGDTLKPQLLLSSSDNLTQLDLEDIPQMGQFIGDLMVVPGNDFVYDIRQDERNVSDFYYIDTNVRNGFRKHTWRMKSWASLIQSMIEACMINRSEWIGKELVAHRSCMEAVEVVDKNSGQLLLYIDLVWWTLAASTGIINDGNAAAF